MKSNFNLCFRSTDGSHDLQTRPTWNAFKIFRIDLISFSNLLNVSRVNHCGIEPPIFPWSTSDVILIVLFAGLRQFHPIESLISFVSLTRLQAKYHPDPISESFFGFTLLTLRNEAIDYIDQRKKTLTC